MVNRTSQLREERNNGIDVLRGISMLFVILLHINIHFNLKTSFLVDLLSPKVFSFLFWNGLYGVVIFFTLSGYLITSSILRRSGNLSSINLKQFYWYRFSRIMPPLLVLLVVLSLLHVTGVHGYVLNPDKTSLARAVFSVLTFHFNWLEIQIGYLPANWDVLWSISIEESFYLIFPIVCLFLKKDEFFVFFFIVFLFLSPWARVELFPDNELAYKNHLGSIDAIAFGCMTAILSHKFTLSRAKSLIIGALGIVIILFVTFFKGFFWKTGLTQMGLNITLLSAGVAFLLFWLHVVHRSGSQTKFTLPVGLRQMGVYSYEIYLTHMFVIIPVAQIIRRNQLGEDWLVPLALVCVLFSYLLGKVIATFFSEPVNVWLRAKWRTSK